MALQFKWQQLIPLKQNKSGYEPSLQQIREYGQYLGFSFPIDSKYEHLFKQALQAPLPDNWEACEVPGEASDIVYRNQKTRQIQYEHPLDFVYQNKIMKMKSLSQALPISQIVQQGQSWLKDSSHMKSSNEPGVQPDIKEQKDDYLINQISEESSIYQQQSSRIEGNEISLISSSKGLKTKRSYRKQKNKPRKILPQSIQTIQQQREELLNKIRSNFVDSHLPSITRDELVKANYSKLNTGQQMKKATKLTQRLKELQDKKQELGNLMKAQQQIDKRMKIRREIPLR